tara:strand:- start:1367 stop:1594 length:228 start_codon:yes stop_codon:yes gene_type:complete
MSTTDSDSSALLGAAWNVFEANKANRVCTQGTPSECLSLLEFRAKRRNWILLIVLGSITLLLYKSYKKNYKDKDQ